MKIKTFICISHIILLKALYKLFLTGFIEKHLVAKLTDKLFSTFLKPWAWASNTIKSQALKLCLLNCGSVLFSLLHSAFLTHLWRQTLYLWTHTPPSLGFAKQRQTDSYYPCIKKAWTRDEARAAGSLRLACWQSKHQVQRPESTCNLLDTDRNTSHYFSVLQFLWTLGKARGKAAMWKIVFLKKS